MVEASTVMKIMMYVNMIFFVGMTTFPGPFADGYKMDFSCPARPARGAPPCDEKKNTALLWFAFNLFGIQLGSLAGMAGALARDGVSKKAQSAFLFVTMISYPFLTISDLIATTTDDFTNSGTPKEGIYFNTVLFSALTVAIYLAWQGTGGYVPDVNKLVPTGRFSTCVIINLVNGLFFALPLMLFRDQFLEMFGMNEPLTNMGANKWIVMLIFGNIGKVLFWNCVAMLVVATAEGGDKGDDTQYRLIRVTSIFNMFYLGSFSKDVIVNNFTGFADPMRTMTFVQMFAVTYYTMNTWAGAGFTLKKKM